jgi:phage terminase large subunit-like protein
MVGSPVFMGLDLASTRDLTALVLLFPPVEDDDPYVLIPRFYMPEDNIQRRVEDAGVPYREWVDAGHIIATPGDVVDYDYIRQDIDNLAPMFSVQEIALDRHNATHLMTQLQDGGYTVVPFSQYIASMNGPMKELERLLIGRMIEHDANPVLRWMVGNVAPKEDADGRIKPDRSRSAEKIDGVVSTIMALGRAIEAEAVEGSSVYEERGIREL